MKELIRSILREDNENKIIPIIDDIIVKFKNLYPNIELTYKISNNKLVNIYVDLNNLNGKEFEKISNKLSHLLSPYYTNSDSDIKFDYTFDISDKTFTKFINSQYINKLKNKLDELGIDKINGYLYSFDGTKSKYLEDEITRREGIKSNKFFLDIKDFLQSFTDVPLDIKSKTDKGLNDLKIKINIQLTFNEFNTCKYKKWLFPTNERELEDEIVKKFPFLTINQHTQVRIEFVWPREIGEFIVSQNNKLRSQLSKTLLNNISVLVDYGPCINQPIFMVATQKNEFEKNRNYLTKVSQVIGKTFPKSPPINISNEYWRVSKKYQTDDKRYWSKQQMFDFFVIQSKNSFGDSYEYDINKFNDLDNLAEVFCKQHQRWFEVFPKEHISGKRCPFDNESKGETLVRVYLEKNKISFKQYQKLQGCFSEINGRCILLTFDFYLPELNVVIEYDGEQHFRPIERFGGEKTFNRQKMLDEIKNKFCDKSNIKMIRLPYTVKKSTDIKKLLDNELNIVR